VFKYTTGCGGKNGGNMSNEDVDYAKNRLVKVLSSSANSADVAAIVDAVERLIEAKVNEAIEIYAEPDAYKSGEKF
jgi:hypothetical protein